MNRKEEQQLKLVEEDSTFYNTNDSVEKINIIIRLLMLMTLIIL